VNGGARTLLHRPNGSFDFANVVGGGGDVESQWEDIVTDALKFHVGMQIGDVVTPGLVHCQDWLDLTEKGCFVPVEYWRNGEELNFARYGVKEGWP
jgi:hypothetical protein